MGSEVIIVPILFGVIFGIFYLFISSRHKERLSLIEKGADASIFYNKDRKLTPVWKIFVLNLALLLIGIGVGIFLASLLHYNFGVEEGVAYSGTIFLVAGVSLFVGFNMSKKLD